MIYTAATVAAVVATATIVDKVNESVKEQERKDNQRNHLVYQLIDKNDNGKVKYVGRTINENARKQFHKKTKPNLKFEVQRYNLTKAEARGLEQVLIIQRHVKQELGGLNKINGISPNNPRLGIYMRAALPIAKDLLGAEALDEALYWMHERWR